MSDARRQEARASGRKAAGEKRAKEARARVEQKKVGNPKPGFTIDSLETLEKRIAVLEGDRKRWRNHFFALSDLVLDQRTSMAFAYAQKLESDRGQP